MGWRGICAVLQRLSQKLAALAPTPNPSRLREGNVLDWPFPGIPNLSAAWLSASRFSERVLLWDHNRSAFIAKMVSCG
ncbi:hypothetical protein GCM10019071_36790 [Sphingobium fuliginis]|uniref:Uncharacterized protein n=1 Tax=Sphingobium fuliginis (strain ATCC 27551) TaxID=336203 RepID=A0ABQ1F9I0_SPHSA|nr:hypothetical protein GCM10019071_36790 [Sphingobium fuliginis]